MIDESNRFLQFLEDGEKIQEVSKVIGHSNINTTAQYNVRDPKISKSVIMLVFGI